ncbi:MAG: IS5 family transposase [Phycisphaerae bacterium]|nr:IS5 family transposase [Phycisphaerae bacterium]
MHATPDKQICFEDRIYSLIPENHFLKALQKAIDWKFIDKRCRQLYSEKGRPAHPAQTMFKLILLQFMYNLSDRQLEEAVRFRINFRWFVGLTGLDPGPDHTTFCRFRDRIGAHTLAVMMNDVVEQASQAGLVSDMLSITDATHVKAKVNTYRWKDDDENPGGKQGPDSDAKFGRKSEKKQFFGYKCSVSQDADSGIITDVEVAPGNVSDSSMFPDVADDAALAVTADKGYDAPQNYELLRERGQEAAIIPKRRRGKARGHVRARYPDDGERERYYRRKKKRGRVEAKFGEMKKYHGLGVARYYGLAKMEFQAIMTAVAVNVKRMVTMLTGRPRWVMT